MLTSEPVSCVLQTNERTLEWEESAQVQLLKIYVAQKSGQVLAVLLRS
jgi:hypothetical protein